MDWFPVFLFLLTLGIAGAMAVVPPKEIGNTFFRFNGMPALWAATIGLLLAKPWRDLSQSPMHIFAALSSMTFVALTLVQNVVLRVLRSPPKADLLLAPVSVGVPYAVFSAVAMRSDLGQGLLLGAHFLTSSAVLGFTLVTMILGHWYLSNALLSFDLLRRMTRLLLFSLAAKAIVSGLFLALNFGRISAARQFDGMLVLVRLGAGIVLLFVLAAMAHSCARIKSNQSATGILYVATVFVLIGELDSLYLTLVRGLPV